MEAHDNRPSHVVYEIEVDRLNSSRGIDTPDPISGRLMFIQLAEPSRLSDIIGEVCTPLKLSHIHTDEYVNRRNLIFIKVNGSGFT